MADVGTQYDPDAGGMAEAGAAESRAGAITLHWAADGMLMLTDQQSPPTRIVGGPLVELAPPTSRRRGRALRPKASNAPISAGEPFADALGSGTRWRRTVPLEGYPLALELVVAIYRDSSIVRVEAALRNDGAEALAVRRLFPFVAGAWWGTSGAIGVGGRTRGFAVYKHGWQSWSYAGGLPPGVRDPRPRVPTNVAFQLPAGRHARLPFAGARRGRADVVGDEMVMLGQAGGSAALLTGFLDARRWLGQIYADRGAGTLAAAALLDDARLAPGARIEAPPLLLALGDQTALPERYAAAVAAELGVPARPRDAWVPTGWCSWYYYFTNASQATVLENLDAVQRLQRELPLDVVQIDDGYQAAIGDWLDVNAKFPDGLAALASRIRATGRRPGLWLAPFTVGGDSRLAREHPDWLVHDAAGKLVVAGHNWGVDLRGLDLTHPDARAWLRRVISTVVHEWGFDYLKLDFLVSGAVRGHRYDSTVPRAQVLRDGLALIREVAGPHVFILGCGCPLLSAMGLVDAMRIGPDSAPYWAPRYRGLPMPFSEGHALPSMQGAIRNTLTRAWADPAWWINDPDCLLVREHDSGLSLDEVRMFATAVGLTGGMVVDSDRLVALGAERHQILAALLPPLPERARPSEYFAAGIPERAAIEIVRPWGRWLLVGLFNGERAEREMTVRWHQLGLAAGEYHAVEFWSGRYLGCSAEGVTLRVAPHGAAALAIRRATGEPQLLSTSFHIGQGAVEIAAWEYDRAALTVRWQASLGRHAAGTFTLWLPAGLSPRRLTAIGGARALAWRREPSGEVVVASEIAGDATFTLEMEPAP